MTAYEDFLRSKAAVARQTGFEVDPVEVNPILKPHQRDAVVWAVRGGRRALFESFGLGKTMQQLEIGRWLEFVVREHEDAEPRPTRPYGADVRLHVVPAAVAREAASPGARGAVAC